MNTFKTEHGHFPDELLELTPHYLATLELPTVGVERWQYEHSSFKREGLYDDDRFWLSFATSGNYPSCTYESFVRARWRCDE